MWKKIILNNYENEQILKIINEICNCGGKHFFKYSYLSNPFIDKENSNHLLNVFHEYKLIFSININNKMLKIKNSWKEYDENLLLKKNIIFLTDENDLFKNDNKYYIIRNENIIDTLDYIGPNYEKIEFRKLLIQNYLSNYIIKDFHNIILNYIGNDYYFFLKNIRHKNLKKKENEKYLYDKKILNIICKKYKIKDKKIIFKILWAKKKKLNYIINNIISKYLFYDKNQYYIILSENKINKYINLNNKINIGMFIDHKILKISYIYN